MILARRRDVRRRGRERRRCPTPAFRSTCRASTSARRVAAVHAAGRRRRRRSATTCSSSIPTARSATRCRSCARTIACVPSLGVSAALRAAGIRPQRRAAGRHACCAIGDRAMPLSLAPRRRPRTASLSLSLGPDRFPRPGAARRFEDAAPIRPIRSSTCCIPRSRSSPGRRPTSIRRCSATRSSSSARPRRACSTSSRRRSRNGKMPGVQIHAAVADDILSNRFIREARAPVRVATVVGVGARDRPGRDGAAGVVGGGGHDRVRRGARRGWRRDAVRRRLLAEPLAAGARVVARAVRRRRLPVLRRRPREAEDEEAVRPVRLEGRLRAAGRESGAGAARRSAPRDDRAVLRHPRLHDRLRARAAGRNRRHAERVLHADGRDRVSRTTGRSTSSSATW